MLLSSTKIRRLKMGKKQTYTTTFSMRVSKAEKAHFDKVAKDLDLSVSAMIRLAIKELEKGKK